jgi:hypothetical protein
MKRAFLGLAVFLIAAMTIFGLSSQTMASEQIGGGPGAALLFTYYDVRSVAQGGLGLTDNYFSVINTSTHWVQSHVRIRTGDCSVELLDFDVLQSPKDIFVFDVYDEGGITFASCDTNTLEDSGFNLNFDANGDGTNDCFILSAETFPAMLSLITQCGDCATGDEITAAQALSLVKKGYVEVIEEGSIRPGTSSSTKNKCFDANTDDGDDGIIIPGKSLLDLYSSDCIEDVYAPVAELQGRQYHVQVNLAVSPVVIKRIAMADAAVIHGTDDSTYGLILHEATYGDELLAAPCNQADGSETRCYAYAAPSTGDGVNETADGANDMNWCFYVDAIDKSPVINKFGAGATFGPTLADVSATWGSSYRRDGSLDNTARAIHDGLTGLSAFDMVDGSWTDSDWWTKQYMESHYFWAPKPGPYDVRAGFAFIFPLKHFIGEKETIKALNLYDNSENTVVTELGKFISPGLPSPETFSEEANLFLLTPPFNEGWVRFEVSATNATTGCTDLFPAVPTPGDCQVLGYDVNYDTVATPATKYVPAYLGLVFTTGSEALGCAPAFYNNQNIVANWFGRAGDSR